MKKTLTLFLIGAMALGTAFTFSSCSGGSEKEKSSDGVITLNDFRKGKKIFHVNALGHIVLVPDQNQPEAAGALEDSVYVTGRASFFGYELDCRYVYRTDELNHESGEPSMAWLWITFENVGATTEMAVMAALGQDPQGPGLSGGAVEMQFNFTTYEVEVLSSVQGTVTINYPDPMGEYLTFNAWIRTVENANFYVTKAGLED